MYSKKKMIAFIKGQLTSNPFWAVKALLVVYGNQTVDEQNDGDVKHHNKKGFTAMDAEILTSFAKQYKQRGALTSKQMLVLHRLIPKYAKQCFEAADQRKLVEKMNATNCTEAA